MDTIVIDDEEIASDEQTTRTVHVDSGIYTQVRWGTSHSKPLFEHCSSLPSKWLIELCCMALGLVRNYARCVVEPLVAWLGVWRNCLTKLRSEVAHRVAERHRTCTGSLQYADRQLGEWVLPERPNREIVVSGFGSWSCRACLAILEWLCDDVCGLSILQRDGISESVSLYPTSSLFMFRLSGKGLFHIWIVFLRTPSHQFALPARFFLYERSCLWLWLGSCLWVLLWMQLWVILSVSCVVFGELSLY